MRLHCEELIYLPPPRPTVPAWLFWTGATLAAGLWLAFVMVTYWGTP